MSSAITDQTEKTQGALPPSLHSVRSAAPLTALVVEFHTQRCRPNQPEIEDPLGKHLGHARILRVSPLVPIPDAC